MMNTLNSTHTLECAKRTIEIEVTEVQRLKERLDESFVRAVQLVMNAKGRVIVSGIGKSGHVARKIAATLASTGTAAYFVHPAEASHGDLGMITPDDVIICISNSGETQELTAILPVVKRLGAGMIAITGKVSSSLARYADVVLDSSVQKEACPLNLAPTASTTVQMVLGDALAMALLDARGFREEDFARSHPGGALGRQLLTYVKDVMRPLNETPKVLPETGFSEVMLQMTKSGMGMTVIVDLQNHVQGIFTDG
ncbi:MAG: KpsF/GutQ family sugar-phosphate isomerase, partial [Saezia sp.]